MDPLTPLDRELTASLHVDPSPEFVARVRARVATDPIDSVFWHAPGQVVAGGALAALLYVAIMFVPRVGPQADPIVTTLLPQRDAVVWAPLRAGFAPDSAVGAVPLALRSPAPVMVSAAEMAALQQLFSGRFGALEWPEASAQELVIQEISIEPIAFPSDPEGAGQ